jgi:hypothetical protein
VFRHRERGQIYTFQDEDEMLTWLAVFNQAVAAVVIKERLSYMQLHDYHGGLSLMYIPERLRPAVLYVAHNAHYDATFPIPTPARRNKIYEHLNLNAEQVNAYAEHNGRFDILRSVVMVLRNQQQGHGVVAVSPRYAKQIKQKLSVFWQLSAIGRPRSITGILNALDMGNSLASQPDLTAEQVADMKRAAKLQLQERYGLAVGNDYKLLVFVGRITHQKGCDIIAEVRQAGRNALRFAKGSRSTGRVRPFLCACASSKDTACITGCRQTLLAGSHIGMLSKGLLTHSCCYLSSSRRRPLTSCPATPSCSWWLWAPSAMPQVLLLSASWASWCRATATACTARWTTMWLERRRASSSRLQTTAWCPAGKGQCPTLGSRSTSI